MNEEPSWLTPDEQHAWRTFVRLQSKLIGRISRDLQTESNLSTADYAVLVNLTEIPEGRLRFLDLARAVEWEKSRMSHHIARMAKRGLVTREPCPEDGRGAFVVATPAGREAIAAAAPRHAGAVRRLFIAPFTPQELYTFTELSKRLLEQLERDSLQDGFVPCRQQGQGLTTRADWRQG
ncbi:MarR family winged helix-turn-helix transcriptional regulator [Streptomyces scopuliridis]|uniref:MarR family winged helix-turn-helix transcriptional regulator n=1 Tax=Streptomyces scopuliridis TaxID=452529 RepID=UPI0036A93462